MEGDAGTGQLNPTDADAVPKDASAKPDEAHPEPDESLAVSTEEEPTEQALGPPAHPRRAARLGRGWAVGICVTLVLLAAAGAVGGFLALKAHHHNEATARAEAAALQAAKDCVAATHAPDTAAMTAAQAKIIECSTGDFAVQASLYSGVLVDAYQAADVQVQVSDMRAAVEKHHQDGSFDILVAVQVKVTNSDTVDQEQGYRLRVQMAPDEGTYKVARLDQVTS